MPLDRRTEWWRGADLNPRDPLEFDVGKRPEFGALFGLRKSIRTEENSVAGIRFMYGSLSGSLRDFVDARNLVTSNIRLMFGVRISPSPGRAVNNSTFVSPTGVNVFVRRDRWCRAEHPNKIIPPTNFDPPNADTRYPDYRK